MAIEKVRDRRTSVGIEGSREAKALTATLGGQVRASRIRLRLTQQQLAARVGISRPRLAELERGHGAGAPFGTWIALGLATGRPLAASFSRGLASEPHDAGHLALQELVLGLAERNGVTRHFELPTRPANPALSVDVLLRLDAHRALAIVEIWNRLDDLGAAVRNTHRKQAEAGAVAVVAGGAGGPYRVAACWVLRDSAPNRDLVRRYPAILRAEFHGSSRAWVAALEGAAAPPSGSGLVWAHPTNGLGAVNVRRGPNIG